MQNLLTELPDAIATEIVDTLMSHDNVRIERIVSHGQASPDGFWYDQDQCEWVIVLQGAATLRFEDRSIELRPGDFVTIDAHQKHRVEWTTPDKPTIWLAIFYGSNP